MSEHEWVPFEYISPQREKSGRVAWVCTNCGAKMVRGDRPALRCKIHYDVQFPHGGPNELIPPDPWPDEGYTCDEWVVKRIHDA